MADRKNKLGLSVAIGAGIGAALGVALHHPAVVAEPRLRRWHRDRNYFDANDAILILSRHFGSFAACHAGSHSFARKNPQTVENA
jgi:hypothetical protein